MRPTPHQLERTSRLIRTGSTKTPASGGKPGAAPAGAGAKKTESKAGSAAAKGAADKADPKHAGMEPQRKQALDFALQQIGKKCGQGAIMYLGDESRRRVDTISTGSISLDRALGVGGLPRARVVEVFGPESSGKTTLTLHVVLLVNVKVVVLQLALFNDLVQDVRMVPDLNTRKY